MVGENVFWFWWNAIGAGVTFTVAVLLSYIFGRSSQSEDDEKEEEKDQEPFFSKENVILLAYFMVIIVVSISMSVII